MVWINALIKLVNNKETLAINQAKYNVIIVIIIVTITIILMINSLQWYAPSRSILIILYSKNKINKTPKKYSMLIKINIILCNYSNHIIMNNSWNIQQ